MITKQEFEKIIADINREARGRYPFLEHDPLKIDPLTIGRSGYERPCRYVKGSGRVDASYAILSELYPYLEDEGVREILEADAWRYIREYMTDIESAE